MAEPPTVFVVDDDHAVRESLRWLVESIDLRVETYDSAKAFLANCGPDRPGCLVLDVRMPGMTGLDLQESLESHGITLPVIVITGYGDVPTAVRAMRQNAVDFLEKPFNDLALLELIQHCVERDAENRQAGAARRNIGGKYAKLTPREREVLELVCTGMSNKEVARKLGVSPKTIEVHRARVMEKMGAESFAELVQMAGVIAPNTGNP
jgi:RNA polymerase sigma factor (sigma-70 family)